MFKHRSISGGVELAVSPVLSSQVTSVASDVPDNFVTLQFEYSTVSLVLSISVAFRIFIYVGKSN